jgi:predicted aconitase with swiveling domain
MARVTRMLGRPLLPGSAASAALAADVPLSFWGGFDPDSGEIIDRRHPLSGHIAADQILVLPAGRGSCSGSGVLLESIRNGTAPAAIILSHPDPIIGLGAILGDELFAKHPVLILLPDVERASITTGDRITIDENGRITVCH